MTFLVALIAIGFAVLAMALICLLPAFVLMVILGALAHIFVWPVLAVGYGTAFLLTLLLAIFL